MSDSFNEGLKKVLYTGIGIAAMTADMTVKAVDSLAKKGEEAVQKGKVLNEELKRKRADAESGLSEMADALAEMTKEEIESIRAKLAEIEIKFEETKTDAKMNVEDIMSSLEKMSKEQIASLKARIEEIKENWTDDNDKGADD